LAIAAVVAVTGGIAIAVVAACGVISASIAAFLSYSTATTAIELSSAQVMAAAEKHKNVRDSAGDSLSDEDPELRLAWCGEAKQRLDKLESEAHDLEMNSHRGCCGCAKCCQHRIPDEEFDLVRIAVDKLEEKAEMGPVNLDDSDLKAYKERGESLEKHCRSVAMCAMTTESVKKQSCTCFTVVALGGVLVLVALVLKHFYW